MTLNHRYEVIITKALNFDKVAIYGRTNYFNFHNLLHYGNSRLAISFLGMRGIGSLYYLAYALNEEDFEHVDEIWALVALVVVISIVVFGTTATPITEKLDKMREKEA